MPAYHVREARPEDAAAIIAHVRQVADEPNNGISISSADEFQVTEEKEIEWTKEAAAADNALMLVAEATDGQIIGVAHCRGGKGGYYHTLDLGITVKQNWRNQGVGTAMMQSMIDWCRANPVVYKLELWVFPDNPRAIHVYEKAGFQQEGRRRSCFLKQGQMLDLILMGIVFER
jgi:RimJ/RimL family protein N-acetyltransferase